LGMSRLVLLALTSGFRVTTPTTRLS
jgi:hypothetical protein